MKLFRLLALVLALALLAGCSTSSVTPTGNVTPTGRPVRTGVREIPTPQGSAPPVGELACVSEGALDGYNAFSLDLLKSCREEGENTLISPLSVALALGMTANGAAGSTLREFETLFGLSRNDLNSLCARFLNEYQNLGGSTESTLVNSLWADPDITLTDDFVLQCMETYGAKLYNADLQDAATVKAVNGWCSEATKGLIPTIVDKFDEDAVLALINAVYLKNAFARPFKTPTTDWEMDFHNADGTLSRPKGMSNGTRNEEYIQAENGHGVVLPYDDGRLGLLLMLPNEGMSLEDLLSGWDGSTVPELLSSRTSTRVALTMPKYRTEWSGSLKDQLSALGLVGAFDPEAADFTAMGTLTAPMKHLCVGDVIHKTAFEVNEKGTEAAAVTAVVMVGATAMPPQDMVYLNFDRPFVYGIVDLLDGCPLFLGTVEHL